MLNFERTGHFKKDFKKLLKQQKDITKLETVLAYLIKEEPLPKEYLDHPLRNCRQYTDSRECHIEPDWLLIYRIDDTNKILRLIRTGSHSDLFS